MGQGVVRPAQLFQRRIENGALGASGPVEVTQERQPLATEDERLQRLVDPAGDHDENDSSSLFVLAPRLAGSQAGEVRKKVDEGATESADCRV